ncbi:NAD(FAD)-utilizing dehydrogenase [Hymenobacter qilianensis]|uniref:TIGR03862 family flavoprotein n=2 Tax=Hymenobacter qilianensis TaxID=1385715 RepID=A0A7H0GTR4_9BACT|nr:TIGR03862 family flavoprotein [Hymenobacter qilianensis]QNP51680.1 TIGR03862 family flavoprotein [Hymenobacter qilianensis]GGF72883.1 NAD(FAD)-utilizing dehydrogenase [Hymenobacter qilianensis]
MSDHPSIAIIGGGPAGLLAAQHLAEAGHRVTVYEAQATVGRKFLVAGHGGFNLTHSEPLPTFGKRYGAHQEPFASFLTHFGPEQLRAWAADLGVETFVGSSGRIFPTADYKPAQLLRAWLTRLAALGVVIKTRHRWLGFVPDSPNGLLVCNEQTGEELEICSPAVVLALGGASWAKTGSDGGWTSAFSEIGVRCTPFAPANCGAEIAWGAFFKEKVVRAPLKNIALTCEGQTMRGELMLTDYGVEGTPVYALTPALRTALSRETPATLWLNLKPDLTHNQLVQKLSKPRGSKSWGAFLQQTLHLGPPVPTLLREVAPPDTITSSPESLARLLQQLPLPVRGLRPLDEAISTAGGVAWEELDENLMLRRRPGTFVAGEMLDWEAPTGGYLLQGCFSTGAWVADAVTKRLA